jgi:uncharacterized sulfatase
VTVDSLRRDAVDRSPQTHTPTLCRLADRGTWVEHATAQGNWTPFSFPSILGGRPVFADQPTIGVGSTPTLAETLADAGVQTAGFNAANGFLTDHWGYDRGFDTFESFMPAADGPLSRWLTTHPTVKAWLQFASHPVQAAGRRLVGSDLPDPENVSRLRDVETAAIDFLIDVDGPFFCWVHLMDTHTPYVPAPKHVKAVSDGELGSAGTIRAHLKTGLGRAVSDQTLDALRTLYLAAARQTDAAIGRLLDALADAGLREETAVIVAGDHGEEFQEHGHLAHYPKLYRELVDVPLILDLPDDDRERIDTPVGLDAVPVTLCDVLGVSPPTAFTGQSLHDSVESSPVTSLAVRGDAVTAQPIPRSPADGEVLVSARTADWTYIQHTDSGREELYDRRDDPDEQHDRLAVAADGGRSRTTTDAATGDAPLAALQAAAKRRLQTLRHGETQTATPDEVADQLAALGYR